MCVFSSVFAKPIVFDDSVLDSIHDCVDIHSPDVSIVEVFDTSASLKCDLSSASPNFTPYDFLYTIIRNFEQYIILNLYYFKNFIEEYKIVGNFKFFFVFYLIFRITFSERKKESFFSFLNLPPKSIHISNVEKVNISFVRY